MLIMRIQTLYRNSVFVLWKIEPHEGLNTEEFDHVWDTKSYDG